MRRYLRLAGESGVVAYAIAPDAIDVQFVDGQVYTYSYASTGRERVEAMKRLAQTGRGLSTYISQHVGSDYAARRQA
ncbi:hypothetical protein LP420_20620 [Massilia sp. B-10]|nr:hypothetical protein LP420_20620 [Massilia sp. B-10]